MDKTLKISGEGKVLSPKEIRAFLKKGLDLKEIDFEIYRKAMHICYGMDLNCIHDRYRPSYIFACRTVDGRVEFDAEIRRYSEERGCWISPSSTQALITIITEEKGLIKVYVEEINLEGEIVQKIRVDHI